jgi:hypothetical protein
MMLMNGKIKEYSLDILNTVKDYFNLSDDIYQELDALSVILIKGNESYSDELIEIYDLLKTYIVESEITKSFWKILVDEIQTKIRLLAIDEFGGHSYDYELD